MGNKTWEHPDYMTDDLDLDMIYLDDRKRQQKRHNHKKNDRRDYDRFERQAQRKSRRQTTDEEWERDFR